MNLPEDTVVPSGFADQELDSAGYGTGVEVEHEDLAPHEIHEPFDPDEIDVVTRTPTVDLLLSRVRTGRIDLQPDFQRRAGIWTRRAKSRLIESLLLRIPLPTLYAAEDDDESWAIVDGIQRLTAITEFVDPDAISAEPLALTDLEYLTQCEGMSFDELPGRLQTRLREAELVLHLIRVGTPETVKFNIFARINTGGLPLSNQELRHALIPGPARQYLKTWADSEYFKSATGHSVRSDRMADREMVLRFIAFWLSSPDEYGSQDFDKFLRNAMTTLNKFSNDEIQILEREFENAMQAAEAIFGSQAFRKRNLQNLAYRSPINKALFESISVNLARLDPRAIKTLIARKSRVEKNFLRLMEDAEFQVAISQGTGDIAKVRRRFARINELFAKVAQ